MENTSNTNSSLGANLGVGGDLSAPGAATGFGLEDQSSTMPSMPTMMAASPDPVSLAGEESTVFKEEPSSSPAPAPAQAPVAAPSPDEQVLHGLSGEITNIIVIIINLLLLLLIIIIIIINFTVTVRQRARQVVLSREGQLLKRSRSLSVLPGMCNNVRVYYQVYIVFVFVWLRAI